MAIDFCNFRRDPQGNVFKNVRSGLFAHSVTVGFTLIELLVGLTVAAVLIGLAAPSMQTFIKNNRIFKI